MKVSVVLALVALVAVVRAAPPPLCTRSLADYTDGATRFTACQGSCSGLTQDDATTTSQPITLLTDASGNPSHAAASTGPFSTASLLTQFNNDHVLIYFSESLRYYGKSFGGSSGTDLDGTKPDVRFGTNAQIADAAHYNALFDKIVLGSTSDQMDSSCQRYVEMDLQWGNFLAAYPSASGNGNAGDANGGWTRVQNSGSGDITYTVYFSVVNYEYISITRPSGQVIALERTLQHTVPFKLTFVTQASIQSTSIQVYSTIYALAAIVSQAVTVDLTSNTAYAVINLYTSIQNPFVIDELRVVSGPSGSAVPSGDVASDVVSASSSTYSTIPLNVYVDSGSSDTTARTLNVNNQGLASQNGGLANGAATPGPNTFNAARANEASSCDGTGATCSQIWPIRLAADISSNVCNFDGSYLVTFTIRCRSDLADTLCPINRNSGYNNQRVAVGTVGDFAGINQEQFTLTLSSSNHCPTVIDTIGLSAVLYTHGEPITASAVSGSASLVNVPALDVSGTPYISVPSTTLASAGLPNGNYTSTTGASPVLASNDPDGFAWGPDAPVAGTALATPVSGVNERTAFLNGQWVFGVAAVQVQQATVVRSSITSLSISNFGSSGVTQNVVSSGLWDSSYSASFQGALKFAFVDDVTPVNINNANKIAYPYFFFQVDENTLGISADSNKAITIAGTVTVTYQNAVAGSSLGAEELLSVEVPFEFLFSASAASLKKTGSSIAATIGVGNSASTGTASAGNSTFLGVSSSTAAGVALAVGVVVGLLVGLLVAAARRPGAPTKSASQVQLTSAASTSAV